jgi:hypothetical protein
MVGWVRTSFLDFVGTVVEGFVGNRCAGDVFLLVREILKVRIHGAEQKEIRGRVKENESHGAKTTKVKTRIVTRRKQDFTNLRCT